MTDKPSVLKKVMTEKGLF